MLSLGLADVGPATVDMVSLTPRYSVFLSYNRCEPCIAYHAEGAIKAGATRDQVAETLAMAVYMGAGPSVMYAAKALEAVDQFTSPA